MDNLDQLRVRVRTRNSTTHAAFAGSATHAVRRGVQVAVREEVEPEGIVRYSTGLNAGTG
jgi:hypothetical protein